MQQLNINEYYELGKKTQSMLDWLGGLEGEIPVNNVAWKLFTYRWSLHMILKEPCALLPGCQRSIRGIINRISQIVPEDIDTVLLPNKDAKVDDFRLKWIADEIKQFETILKNDMPEMSAFAVAQLGMYRTEDLINRPYVQIDEPLRGTLPPLAKQDIIEAGKCLAFRVSTAAAFHLSRAIETCMNQYYEALTGKPFSGKDATRNWAIKTDALKTAGADDKITEFLVHIRKAYRNPVTHPDVILEPSEAFNLFPQTLSVISMMLEAVKKLEEIKQPLLTGYAEALEGADAIATQQAGSNGAKGTLALEAETQ